jgi:hypothetical protein
VPFQFNLLPKALESRVANILITDSQRACELVLVLSRLLNTGSPKLSAKYTLACVAGGIRGHERMVDTCELCVNVFRHIIL